MQFPERPLLRRVGTLHSTFLWSRPPPKFFLDGQSDVLTGVWRLQYWTMLPSHKYEQWRKRGRAGPNRMKMWYSPRLFRRTRLIPDFICLFLLLLFSSWKRAFWRGLHCEGWKLCIANFCEVAPPPKKREIVRRPNQHIDMCWILQYWTMRPAHKFEQWRRRGRGGAQPNQDVI